MSDTSAGDTTIAMTPHDRAERDIDVIAAGRFQDLDGVAISAFHTTHI